MKLKTSMALLAALLMVGCVPTTNSSTPAQRLDRAQRTAETLQKSESPDMAFVPPPPERSVHSFYTDDGQLVRRTTEENYQVASTTAPPAMTKATQQQAVPADSTEYQVDLVEMTQAIKTRNAGRFVGLPTGFKHGYPVFPATCIFDPGNATCQLSDGEEVDEAYLVAHTTVIRNIDVLGLTCGQICVDEDGNVLGHVSKEMIAWRDRNCTWVDYGTPKCK